MLDEVLDADHDDSGSVLAEALGSWQQLSDTIDGSVARILPIWESSAEWARLGNRSPVVWLVNHLGLSRAAASSLRRTALDAAELPHLSAALELGEISLPHARLLTRARRPEVAEVFDRDEEALVAAAQDLSVDALSMHLALWYQAALAELGINEPDRPLGSDTEDTVARLVRAYQGRGVLTMDLSPEDLARLVEAVDARIEHWRRTGQLHEDDRSWDQLVGAAIMDLIADGSTSSRRGQARPLLIAIATLTALFDRANVPTTKRDRWRAEILGGGPIGRNALRRLVEQANLQLVVTDDDGEPLHVGRAKRAATAAIYAALIARSRGHCEFPGCHASHHRCHAHHLVWWEHGGLSEIENFVLICPHHHRLVHQRGFTVVRGPTGTTWRTPDGREVEPPPRAAAA